MAGKMWQKCRDKTIVWVLQLYNLARDTYTSESQRTMNRQKVGLEWIKVTEIMTERSANDS